MRVVDMAVGAVFGGGLVGTSLQVRHQREVQRNDRRERASPVVAEVVTFVEHIMPVRLAYQRKPSAEVIEPLLHRHAEVRSRLLALAVAHPERKVYEHARKLDISIRSILITTGTWMDLRENGSQDAVSFIRANAEHEYGKAIHHLEELIDAL
jgi:hypothetical protein